MFDYIDIHSHLYFPDFDTDREEEIQKLKENKIATITIGTDVESSKQAVALAHAHEHLYATVGFHPGDVSSETVFPVELERLADEKKVVAIGECGLDYFRLPAVALAQEGDELASAELLQAKQKEIFQAHIDLALSKNLPLMLHVRPQKGSQDAYHDALDMLEAQGQALGENKLRGNVHFFVGDLEVLKRFLSIGFTVSFTGVITFARDYDETVKYAPLHMIMSETDTPFATPIPHRGKRNSPIYIPEIVRKIAEIRGEDENVVKEAMVKNATRFFNLTPRT